MGTWNWKHSVLTISGIGTVACEGIAHQAQATGVSLPWHITAAMLFSVAGVFAFITDRLGGKSVATSAQARAVDQAATAVATGLAGSSGSGGSGSAS